MDRRASLAAGFAIGVIGPLLLQPGGIAMARDAGWRTVDASGTVHRAVLCGDANRRLTIAPAQPGAGGANGCGSIALPVPPRDVRWVGAVTRPDPPGPDRLVLSGSGRGEGFQPIGATFEERPGPPPRPNALALDQPLIPALSGRLFGTEERATLARTDSEIKLHCRGGDRPAGLVLDPGRMRLPDGAAFTLRWQVSGDRGFSAAHAGPDTDGDSVPLSTEGTFDQLPSTRASAWESPRFVLSCPPHAGSLTLHDLRLALPASDRARERGPRSAWAWRSNRWREAPEQLVGEALALGTDRLFVTVEIQDDAIAEEARFSDFVGLARASGIAVAVVEGDPGMALEEGRRTALRRLGALAAYQRRSADDRRLAGVQYDIEPYLLPGFQTDPDLILRHWAATLDGLSAAAPPLALDLVLPFWLPLHGSAGLVLPTIRRVAERITVMAYRTTPAEILTAAEPMLAWTTSAGLPLHVALEAGPVGDETTRIYHRAETGDLLLVPQADGGALALLLTAPTTLHPADRLYTQQREIVFPGSRVSFLGDRRRLDESVAQVSRLCSAWPSFSGIALHGLID
jgi:hypothetical protein